MYCSFRIGENNGKAKEVSNEYGTVLNGYELLLVEFEYYLVFLIF